MWVAVDGKELLTLKMVIYYLINVAEYFEMI